MTAQNVYILSNVSEKPHVGWHSEVTILCWIWDFGFGFLCHIGVLLPLTGKSKVLDGLLQKG